MKQSEKRTRSVVISGRKVIKQMLSSPRMPRITKFRVDQIGVLHLLRTLQVVFLIL